MRPSRTALGVLLIFGAAFPLFYLITMVDLQSYRNAVFAQIQNPGPENEARLRSERKRNEIVRARDALVVEATVSAIAFGAFALYRHERNRGKNRRP